MSVVVRCKPEINDYLDESEVHIDYGVVVADDHFDFDELMENSDYKKEDCKFAYYQLSTDAQLKHNATHVVTISMGEPVGGSMFLADAVVPGPFLLLMCIGEQLKGFHCDECAKYFTRWVIENQPYWKEEYHASRSVEDEADHKSVH